MPWKHSFVLDFIERHFRSELIWAQPLSCRVVSLKSWRVNFFLSQQSIDNFNGDDASPKASWSRGRSSQSQSQGSIERSISDTDTENKNSTFSHCLTERSLLSTQDGVGGTPKGGVKHWQLVELFCWGQRPWGLTPGSVNSWNWRFGASPAGFEVSLKNRQKPSKTVKNR